jgi:hypothetical protein
VVFDNTGYTCVGNVVDDSREGAVSMAIDIIKSIGLGVAGNFAGHLEQTVNSIDFTNVEGAETNAPKGLFPFYVPSNTGHFLEVYPISSGYISLPEGGGNLKVEPELALLCELTYEGDRVAGLMPKSFAAYNDCSIHKPVQKISEKKNWGANSKGLSNHFIDIDHFSVGGIVDIYRLACYIKRSGELHIYGVDSPLSGYSYFYGKLIDWVVDKMNYQTDTDPFEAILPLLKDADFPQYTLIGVGATRYTDYGEQTYLEVNDECFVVVYDSTRYTAKDIEQLLIQGVYQGEGLSILYQTVIS